jgi:hypothetical protein
MIKEDMHDYSEKSIQRLIDNKEVVIIHYYDIRLKKLTLMIVDQDEVTYQGSHSFNRWIIGKPLIAPEYQIYGGKEVDSKCSYLLVSGVKKIEVLDDVHAIVWKLEHGF